LNEKTLTQKSLLRFTGKDNQKIKFIDVKRNKNKKVKTIVENPHPFLKWAGGKRQLLSQIDLYIPKSFNKYIEPFVGGGALFFYLLPKNAILNDINQDLINTYRVIKENVSELITSLKKHKNEEEYFYKIRSVDRNLDEFKTWSDVEKASRIIYLNRCCYNGLYRVNSKGYFNAPFGKYKNPKICNEENLKLVHKVLKDVKLMNTSFELCLNYAKKDDFIYFDPPYVPISESANFTSYTKSSFKKEDQIKLFNVFKELDQKGCKLLLSNSYNEFILKLYKNYQINIVYAKRAINSNPDKRGEIKEILIINNND
jgi:DNA adenine methylase